MKIEKTKSDTETVLKPIGCLDTLASPEFSNALDAASAEAKNLLIDFSAVDFIASSALRALVLAQKKVRAEGRSIVLTGMNEVVKDVFDVTGLLNVFTVR